MSAWLLAVALAAAPLAVAHRPVLTDDGAALALYRYLPADGGEGRPPVLLIGELGFGRALFDVGGEGLARWLAGHGRAVYVAELRGQGRASSGASLRALVHQDFPALARAIAREHPGPIDLVAHGWAGTLALAAAGRELDVRRAVALNTPVLAEVPSVLAERFLMTGGHFSDFSASPQGAEAFEWLFALASRFPPRTLEQVRALGTRDLSTGQAAEWLAWMRTGDLPLDDRTSIVQRLRDSKVPTLLVLGLADGFAGPELCTPLRDFSSLRVRLRTFSRVYDGEDFSHLSLLLGERAPALVFPEVLSFLEETP